MGNRCGTEEHYNEGFLEGLAGMADLVNKTQTQVWTCVCAGKELG